MKKVQIKEKNLKLLSYFSNSGMQNAAKQRVNFVKDFRQ